MRLINYGTGEILDRLTILDLKIQHGGEGQVDHFRNERSALLAKAAPQNTQAWFPLALKLAMVNGLLWRAEDELRSLRNRPEPARAQWVGFGKTWIEEVAGVAVRIQELNDARALCVQEINKLTGENLGPEKING